MVLAQAARPEAARDRDSDSSSASISARAGRRDGRDRRPGLHQLPARRRRGRARARATSSPPSEHTAARASAQGEPVNVEFVSANPTGPLHVGHGRQAALGDAIATLLEWTGWKVTREFYYNDAGAQIENLARSVQARVARAARRRRWRFPRAAITANTSARSPQRYVDAHPRRSRTADDLDADATVRRAPSCARSRTSTCRRSA